MATVMDDDEVAGRQQGQSKDECNNQIVVDCVKGKQALNNMMSGGNGQCKACRWWTTRQEGAVDDARQVGGGHCGAIRWRATQGDMAVDNKTRGGGCRTRRGAIRRWATQQERGRQRHSSLSCCALGRKMARRVGKQGRRK